MTKSHLPILMLGCLFLLGCVIAGSAIAGMRRGRFWYRFGWLTKGGDGVFFWVVTITGALSGLTVAAGAIWLAITYRVWEARP